MKTPRELGLPFDDWRPGQRLAIRTCLHAKTTHIVINAPTGSGKSTIGAALPKLDPSHRHVLLTATKGLQDQYTGTFPFLSDLRGMSNYDCLAAKDEFKRWFSSRRTHVGCEDGPCHDGATCSLKDDGCLYFDARRAFLASNEGLTNYPAWLSNRLYAKGLGQADRLVLDEAHALPEQLMAASRIEIPSHIIDARPPTGYRKWRQWAAQKLNEVSTGRQELNEDVRAKKSKLEESLKALAKIDETWAWDSTENGVTFEPTIPKLLMPLLHTYDGTSTIVYLSATITPATLDLLGIPTKDVTYFTMESTFPIASRPIYLRTAARVDYRSMQNEHTHDRWLSEIDSIIERRLDRKGIIHTTSFERAYDIWNHSKYKHLMIMHHRGQPGAKVVQFFKQSLAPAILVSPSVTTGYDFPYDQAEYQIIAKVPFPDTRSRIAKARCRATPGYRDWLTMTTLVQACGRINRNEDDRGETFIVDGHAQWFLRENEHLMPEWFREAIVRSGRSIRPLPKL